jgi:alpha-galactosidase
MMGKMGYDIRVSEFDENDLRFSQDAISNYNRLRDVIWRGDLYRLASPYEENRAVLMYVDNAKSKAVLFYFTLNESYGATVNRIKLQGLDPVKTYKLQEINVAQGGSGGFRRGSPETGRSYTGDYLMKIGLSIGSATPLTSTVFEISEE